MADRDEHLPNESNGKRGSRFWRPRRVFMKQSTAALVATAAGPALFFSGKGASAADDAFSRQYFDDRVGRWFHVDAGGWTTLELVEVAGNDVSPVVEQFSVTFRGSSQSEFDEGLYVVAPPDGASFELHVQPSGSDASGSYYTASFSLIKPIVPTCAG